MISVDLSLFMFHLFISNALFSIHTVLNCQLSDDNAGDYYLEYTKESRLSLFIGSANSVFFCFQVFSWLCAIIFYNWKVSILYVSLNMFGICKPKGGKSQVIRQDFTWSIFKQKLHINQSVMSIWVYNCDMHFQ